MKNKQYSNLHLVLVAFLFIGCATDTGNVSTDRRGRVTNAILKELGNAVGSVLESSLKNVATDAISGQKVDMAQALTQGLYANMGTIISAEGIGNIMNAWSGNELKPVAAIAVDKVNDLVKQTGPLTPVESRVIMSTIASAVAEKIK